MAGKFGPASVFLLVDGYNMMANKVKSLRHKVQSILEQSDGLGDSWEEHTPVGQLRAEVAQEGAYYDTDTLRSHAALSGSVPSTPQASVRIVSLGFAGQTAGESFMGFEGDFTMNYEVLATRGELQKVNTTHQVSGQADYGQIIQELATKTSDWDTESAAIDYTEDTSQRVVPITSSSVANPTVITTTVPHGLTDGQNILIAGHTGSTPDINDEYTITYVSETTFTIPENVTVGGSGGTLVQANSLNGGAGYQQVTAFSGFSGFIGTIRDSADDITYGDLLAFTDVTSQPAAERKTVSGTVERYLAYKGDVTGSGSVSVFCGFARS